MSEQSDAAKSNSEITKSGKVSSIKENGILAGKNILVTGVLTDASIAFHIARIAQEEGAKVLLTSHGRAMSITERISARLPEKSEVLELDVTNDEHLNTLADRVRPFMPTLDGIVHSIGFAPTTALGGNFLNTEFPDVSTAIHVSTFSYKSLTMACKPLIDSKKGASVVGLTFDATVAWSKYDWMGIAKAGLESANRYLAKYLGPENIRCNLIAAGPLATVAAKHIPDFQQFEHLWNERSPMAWDTRDPIPAALGAVALLSDFFPKTTGEIIHVDGGVHAHGG
jgi:meromycolic acid enoyl-[acyl-carrier-protein] reductase